MSGGSEAETIDITTKHGIIYSNIAGIRVVRSGSEYLRSKERRCLDIVGGLALAAGLSPAAAVAAVGVCIEDRSFNPIFSQPRIGKGGELIDTLKFRTIRRALTEGQAVKAYGTHDPRATRFGQFLRKTGLDEVPQLVNVLRGDMSIVGIRPVVPSISKEFEETHPDIFPAWAEALALAPGLTGLSQLTRRDTAFSIKGYRDSLLLDIEYAKTASLKGDLEIMARTPIVLLAGHLGLTATKGSMHAPYESTHPVVG